MMTLKEIRGKKANENRWEALKLLDWEKDKKVIKYIFDVTNPYFFSSRTPEKIISDARADVEFEEKLAEKFGANK